MIYNIYIYTLSALIFEGLNFREFRGRQIFEHFAGLKFREFREFCEFLLQFREFKFLSENTIDFLVNVSSLVVSFSRPGQTKGSTKLMPLYEKETKVLDIVHDVK